MFVIYELQIYRFTCQFNCILSYHISYPIVSLVVMDKRNYLLCTDEHGQPVRTETGQLLYFCKNSK